MLSSDCVRVTSIEAAFPAGLAAIGPPGPPPPPAAAAAAAAAAAGLGRWTATVIAIVTALILHALTACRLDDNRDAMAHKLSATRHHGGSAAGAGGSAVCPVMRWWVVRFGGGRGGGACIVNRIRDDASVGAGR